MIKRSIKVKILSGFLIILYVVLFMLLVSLLQYTYNNRFWNIIVISFVFNVLLILSFYKMRHHFILLTLLLNILFGSLFFVSGNINLLKISTFIEQCNLVLFYIVQYLIIPNWILPILFFINKKGKEEYDSV
ncbi:hypothetical protein JO41_06685 [Treponema sp. OMZ 838]|nr:hypothetical protein JO41_06685 [Treponema sp. OMZ 838]